MTIVDKDYKPSMKNYAIKLMQMLDNNDNLHIVCKFRIYKDEPTNFKQQAL